MRKTADRIRHAILFEVLALLIATPASAWIFDQPMHDMGVITVGSATIAVVFNYVYNLGFDHAMMVLRGSFAKTLPIRIIHAVLFEAGLLLALAPFIALYLGIGLWPAFLMDVSLAAFYLVYAFTFNWLYDLIFPVPNSTLS